MEISTLGWKFCLLVLPTALNFHFARIETSFPMLPIEQFKWQCALISISNISRAHNYVHALHNSTAVSSYCIHRMSILGLNGNDQ